MKKPDPEMIDAENPEWTQEDFDRAIPFSQLPESLQEKPRALKKQRGPQKASTKEVVTIRLSRDVVEKLRASGPGWQTRVDTVLWEWIEKQPRRRRARRAFDFGGEAATRGCLHFSVVQSGA